MELVRKILLELERQSFGQIQSELKLEGYDDQEISFHVMLLDEAGLVKGIDRSSVSDICWFVERLTWAGYEFLESSRDEKVWKKAVSTVSSKAGGLVFEVL